VSRSLSGISADDRAGAMRVLACFWQLCSQLLCVLLVIINMLYPLHRAWSGQCDRLDRCMQDRLTKKTNGPATFSLN
jgi:fumarate reductase subunit D